MIVPVWCSEVTQQITFVWWINWITSLSRRTAIKIEKQIDRDDNR